MGDKLLDQIFNLKFTSKQLNKQSQKSAKEEKSERLKVKKAIEKGNLDGAKIYAQNAIRKKNESLNYLRLASRLDAVVSRLDTQAKMQSVNKSMAGIVKALDKSLASNNLEQARNSPRPSPDLLAAPYSSIVGTLFKFEQYLVSGEMPLQKRCVKYNSICWHLEAMAEYQKVLCRRAWPACLECLYKFPQVANTMDQFEKQFENLDIQSEFVENAMNAQASLSTPEEDVNMLVQQVAEEHNLESMLNMPAAGRAHAAPSAQQADKSDLSTRLAQLHNQK